ncbi:MAG: response regulator [bacterium]|nr:response regulator [bacterium]
MSTILIIDHEPSVCKQLAQLFSGQGFQVITVQNGVEAARLMRHEAPDLILVDQEIPLSGLKTAQIIRLNANFSHIPVILGMEINAVEEVKKVLHEALEKGVNWVLVKPYRQNQLLAKIQEYVQPGAPPPPPPKQSTETTGMQIRKHLRNLTDLPTLSPSQQQIIAIMSVDDNDVDMDALIKIIETDQALTMRTLKIAKSAGFGFQGDLLSTAITFLGVQNMRQIVQSATILDVFSKADTKDISLDLEGFWKHSMACAMVMQMIGDDTQKSKHFMAGLLHDVGKLILEFSFPPYAKEVDQMALAEDKLRHVAETELIGLSHAEMGQEVADLWGLPREIAESIAYHHAPSLAQRHKRLAALVYLADFAVHQMEIGHSGNYVKPRLDDEFAQNLESSIDMDELVTRKREIEAQIDSIIVS